MEKGDADFKKKIFENQLRAGRPEEIKEPKISSYKTKGNGPFDKKKKKKKKKKQKKKN